MDKLVRTLGITGLSKSQVSEMAKDLDEQVAAFRTRPLDAGPYTFVAADALVMKVRENARVVKIAVMVATGVNAEGYREILGIHTATSETHAGWLAFFRDLVARGLTKEGPVGLVTSDAHDGLVEAIGATLPATSWQRCRTHFAANLMTDPEVLLAVGQGAAAQRVRPARRRRGARPVRPDHRDPGRQAAHRRRVPRPGPRRHPRLHRLPQGLLATDLVQQPPRAAQPRDPAPHRRRRHLPQPRLRHPPGRSRPGRAARRMDAEQRRYLGLELLKQCRAALETDTSTGKENTITIAGAISA
jgi:putative transposase